MAKVSDTSWGYSRFMQAIGTPGIRYSPRAKGKNITDIIGYMLARSQAMFQYKGLPDSIPQRNLELYLQMNGNAGIAEYGGVLYAFRGGLGGEPDPYYMPTIFTVSNPALNFSRNYRIGEECIIIPNDSLYMGLIPMFSRYASSLVESELSLHVALINTRLIDLITAQTSRSKEAAIKMLSDIENGELGVILDQTLDGSIKAFPYSQSQNRTITELIEGIQYLKASWYNELGLNANYNMKRESINSGESQLNNDALLPLVDDMLRCRQNAIDKVNALFGTDITVSLSSSWEDNAEETELELLSLADDVSDQPEKLVEGIKNAEEV